MRVQQEIRWSCLSYDATSFVRPRRCFDGSRRACAARSCQRRNDRRAVVQQWIDVFAALANVVTSSFGYELLDGWDDNVAKLADAWRQAGLSTTPKSRIVFEHLVPFCRQYGRGLGLYSEQTFEAIHYHFDELWKRYVVTDQDSTAYIPWLKMSLVNFNDRNL